MSEFYAGSHILTPISSIIGLSVDKVNFLVTQFAAIGLGSLFQKHLPVSPRGENNHRYVVSILLGLSLCVFCFGHQVVHLLAQALLCLAVLHVCDLSQARVLVAVLALGYLSACHLLRQYWDYGGYTLDISGPLMIQTQRLSSFAFSLYDGEVAAKDPKKLSASQRLHQIKKFPSLLHFFSYLFHFQGIILGPFIFFTDFTHFMEGTWPSAEENPAFTPELCEKLKVDRQRVADPSARIRQLTFTCLFCAFLTLVVAPHFPIDYFKEPAYEASCFPYKYVYMMLACYLIRQKYYVAWGLGELSYLNSGCGFSGLHPTTGRPEFKVVQNFNMPMVEAGTSLKMLIDGWNQSTARWLRECVYERMPSRFATPAVFLVSAFWHGFYPGYYLLFITASGLTSVARIARRRLRHRFQHSAAVSRAYDVVTGVAALTALNYSAVAFNLLELGPSLRAWTTLYFHVHVAAGALYCVLLAL